MNDAPVDVESDESAEEADRGLLLADFLYGRWKQHKYGSHFDTIYSNGVI